MLEKRNRNLCWVQDETVAECCSEPLKQKSGKSTLAALEPRLRKREDGIHLRDCLEHYASARKGLGGDFITICSAFLQRKEEGQQGIASLESGDGFASRG